MADPQTPRENAKTADPSSSDAGKTPPHLQTKDQKGAGPIAEPGSGDSKTDDPRGPGNIGRA